jgi:kinesin family protein 2/24
LEEEENLITNHRKHIDEVVSIVKDEMSLLNVVDKAGSDIEKYVEDLDKVLLSKISIISKLRE